MCYFPADGLIINKYISINDWFSPSSMRNFPANGQIIIMYISIKN